MAIVRVSKVKNKIDRRESLKIENPLGCLCIVGNYHMQNLGHGRYSEALLARRSRDPSD